MANPNKNNPLLHSPLTDRRLETHKENEKKPSGGVNSLKRLEAMRDESARIAREEQEKQLQQNAIINHGKRLDANLGKGSS